MRNWYLPVFLPAGLFPTYGWYVVYGYGREPNTLDGLHVSDVQPVGPWPDWRSTTALCDTLNEEETHVFAA